MAQPILNLNEVMVVSDKLPKDFFSNPAYDKELDNAIQATDTLVYELDDAGEKQAKTDATSINKFAKAFDKFIATTFKSHTEEITAWRDNKRSKTKQLLLNRQKLIDQFAERRVEKLEKTSQMIYDKLTELRGEYEVRPQFISFPDISSIVKLSGSLNQSGSFTKKANEFMQAIVTAELAEQNRIEARHLVLENRCLKEGINPPLTQIHLGTVFFDEEPIFNAKVEELVKAEIDRKAEMEARIIREQEAKKQAEIDAALKAQQAEANRIAREEANRIALECAEQSKASAYKETSEPPPPAPAKKQAVVNGKHQVQIQVTFTMAVSDRVKDKAVQDHFLSQLPERLKAAVDSISTRSI